MYDDAYQGRFHQTLMLFYLEEPENGHNGQIDYFPNKLCICFNNIQQHLK